MCGIAGLFAFHGEAGPDEIREVHELIAELRHRGPDSQQVEALDNRVIFAGARLRITDARNELADQPLCSADGRFAIVFNGEIYNHRLLRSALAGYPFQTNSDTEIALAAFIQWGPAALERFEGMFALAVYDCREQRLFAAVDPGGQKPFYYHQSEEAFVFASEFNAILKDERRRKTLDREALAETVALRFVTGHETHVREVKKLPPGWSITVDPGGVRLSQYFLVPISEQNNEDEDRAARRIRQALERAGENVSQHDGPVAVFLSGGLDSTAVLALALRHRPDNVRTYSIGFEPFSGPSFESGWDADEFEHSDAVAKHFGSLHHKVLLSRDEFFRIYRRWGETMGDPLCVNDPTPLLKLAEVASESCRVVLSGSGSDEIFDGYGKPLTYGEFLNREARSRADVVPLYLQRNMRAFGCDFSKLILERNYEQRLAAKLEADVKPYREIVESPLQLGQLLMFHGRRSAYEFSMLDRTTMRFSIEGRCLFGEPMVTEAAFDFLPELKSKGGNEKYILKRALRGIVPDAVVDRQKAPFPMPGGYFFSPEFTEMARVAIAPGSALMACGILNGDYAASLLTAEDPGCRPIFSRLVLLNLMLEAQRRHLT